MHLPSTIKINTLKAYTSSNKKSQKNIDSANFEWDIFIPKPLSDLCIAALASSFQGIKILHELTDKDRELFIDYLDINFPLKILVTYINDNVFWEKMYKAKWKNSNCLNISKRRWINIYMEKYYSDFWENTIPREYDLEEVTKVVHLCADFIHVLRIKSLIPLNFDTAQNNNQEEFIISATDMKNKKYKNDTFQIIKRDHVSFRAILENLIYLTELDVTFQQQNVGENYRKDQFQLTVDDAKNLGLSLLNCKRLEILRISRSNLDCNKIKYILDGLHELSNINRLDFSHCKLGDLGIHLITNFIIKHPSVREIIFTDNIFGPSGAKHISNMLDQTQCKVRLLDLRLNNMMGSQGVAFLCVAIAKGCNLTSLNISGCGINSAPLIEAPSGVWLAMKTEKIPTCGVLLSKAIGLAKTPLRTLDLSVNNIGSPSDAVLANAVCLSDIIDINLRRSGMSAAYVALAESSVAIQKLRKESEKGIKFKKSASRVVQARRVVKGMNIVADPFLLAQQLSARPSIVSVMSEEGTCIIETQPLPSDFSFVRNSQLTRPMQLTFRRSSDILPLPNITWHSRQRSNSIDALKSQRY